MFKITRLLLAGCVNLNGETVARILTGTKIKPARTSLFSQPEPEKVDPGQVFQHLEILDVTGINSIQNLCFLLIYSDC